MTKPPKPTPAATISDYAFALHEENHAYDDLRRTPKIAASYQDTLNRAWAAYRRRVKLSEELKTLNRNA